MPLIAAPMSRVDRVRTGSRKTGRLTTKSASADAAIATMTDDRQRVIAHENGQLERKHADETQAPYPTPIAIGPPSHHATSAIEQVPGERRASVAGRSRSGANRSRFFDCECVVAIGIDATIGAPAQDALL
jgi:hypothetical protein